MSNSDAYLRAILGVMARGMIPPNELASQVGVGATKTKQLAAYNLCDGTLSQGEIAKAAGLDAGNFSRTVSRWSEDGLIVRTESDGQLRLVHLYPIPASAIKKVTGGV